MNSHELNGTMNENKGTVRSGANGACKGPFIAIWTLGKFRRAVQNAGYYGVQLVYLSSSTMCQFPQCPMRMGDVDRPFKEDDEIRIWKVHRKGEEPRIIPCCAEHRWNINPRNNDVVIGKVKFRESDMIGVFAMAMGFHLVTKQADPIPVVNGSALAVV